MSESKTEALKALRPYCQTPAHTEVLEAVIKHGSNQKAAKALGRSRRGVDEHMQRLRTRASLAQGPLPAIAPDGYMAPGASLPLPFITPNGTLQVGPDGKVERHWPRYKVDEKQRAEALQAALEAMSEDIPREKPVKLHRPGRKINENLLNLYVLTDYHIGMYAWAEETGDDWDLHIAEQLMVDFFREGIAQSPPAAACIFGKLGDFLHWDGIDAVTPTSKHIVDADTRFQLLTRVAIRVTRRVISMLLQKYPVVYVLEAEGNHDIASGMHSREWLAALYEDEPRVQVDTTADIYYCHEWGKTSLFFHHGHKRKPENVDTVFVAKYREIFGRTKYSYAHLGHMHNRKELETNLMVVEQHRTLAAPDAHASRGGWISGREARVITYHKEYGHCGARIITPEMLKE